MSDIVTNICTWPHCAHTAKGQCGPDPRDVTITILRAEIERLRERLEWAAAQLGANGLAAQAFHVRAALAQEPTHDR